MLTGLVYAAVVALWAVVLVPQWLRRHDKHAEHRTSLTFHRAMRTLERRRTARGVSRAPHEMDVVVAGARSRVHDSTTTEGRRSAIDDHLDHGTDPFVGGEEENLLRSVRLTRARTIASEQAARRRKQVQQALIALSLVGVILGFMGVLPVFFAFVAPFVTGVYWYAARQQVGRATVSQQRQQRREAAETSYRRTRSTDGSALAKTDSDGARRSARRVARPARRYVERTGTAHRSRTSVPAAMAAATGTDDVRLLSNEEVVAHRSAAAASGNRWVPQDAPLPTYVNAPRASDNWSAQRMLEQAEALRVPGADAEAELGLDDYLNVPQSNDNFDEYAHRRAVND